MIAPRLHDGSVAYTMHYLSCQHRHRSAANDSDGGGGDGVIGATVHIKFRQDDSGEGSGAVVDEWADDAEEYWQVAVIRRRLGAFRFEVEYLDSVGGQMHTVLNLCCV